MLRQLKVMSCVMPNRNYEAGRRLEYEIVADWRKKGYEVARSAGSHGEWDIFAWNPARKPEFIQCKRVSDEASARRLIKAFREETTPSKFYHQVMVVKVKGSKTYDSITL
jgi:hypothetical protein